MDCAFMLAEHDFRWADSDCTIRKASPICQRNIVSDVILVTGGLVPGALPGVSSPHFTNTAEVLGSYCHVPNLPYPDSDVDWDEGDFFFGPVTVMTSDMVLLACGGVYDDDKSCYFLDVSSQTWAPHSTLPFSAAGASAVVLDDGVYMVGFSDCPSPCEGNDCAWHYHLHLAVGSTHWEKIPLGEDDNGQDLAIGYWVDDCVVATSPWTFLAVNQHDVLEYDSRTSSWSVWAGAPEERVGHACAIVSDQLFIVGGGCRCRWTYAHDMDDQS